MTGRPIFILGCPRSGTMLLSRIIGGCPGNFLITEHTPKMKERRCPEDRSGISDSDIWWSNFSFEGQRPSDSRPPTDVPVYDRKTIEKVRNIYLGMAGSSRLVVKNPTHVPRVPFIKEMFPDALFVFSIRNPWHTLQSMTIKGNTSFLIRTPRTASLPDDLLLKAAASWEECVSVYLKEKDSGWIDIIHEDLLASPEVSISRLFSFLGMENPEWLAAAVKMPRQKASNYYPVRRLFSRSAHKDEILKAIEKGCRFYGYPASPESAEGSMMDYYLGRIRKRLGPKC